MLVRGSLFFCKPFSCSPGSRTSVLAWSYGGAPTSEALAPPKAASRTSARTSCRFGAFSFPDIFHTAPVGYVVPAAEVVAGSRLGAGACSQHSSGRTSCPASSPAAEATVSSGSSSKELARALCAADGADAAPAKHIGRTAACARPARARARSLRKVAGSGPQRPPLSTANTTRWQRGERASSLGAGVATPTPRCLLKGEAGRADCPPAPARRSERQG